MLLSLPLKEKYRNEYINLYDVNHRAMTMSLCIFFDEIILRNPPLSQHFITDDIIYDNSRITNGTVYLSALLTAIIEEKLKKISPTFILSYIVTVCDLSRASEV